MRLITLDTDNFIKQLLPSFLRWSSTTDHKSNLRILLECFLKPFKSMFKEFVEYRKNWFLEARMTGQAILLENYLNIKLASNNKLIVIHNSDELGWLLFKQKEGNGGRILPAKVYKYQEQIDINYDFMIEVKDKSIDNLKIEEIINRFNMANKKYTIIYKI